MTRKSPKHALIEVLRVHKQDLSVHELLQRAYELEPREKRQHCSRSLRTSIRPEMVPDLIARMGGKDPVHQDSPDGPAEPVSIRPTSIRRWKFSFVTQTRWCAAPPCGALPHAAPMCNIDAVAEAVAGPGPRRAEQSRRRDLSRSITRTPSSTWSDALKDESEYARRAAVEVLNEIGDRDSVKDLLRRIKDDDWWVRSRAGDALAEIGGPKVVNAVVELIKDEDEEIRRTAIEILNATKDAGAVDHLIKATDDSDWWVRERAVDALSKIGEPEGAAEACSKCWARTRKQTRL